MSRPGGHEMVKVVVSDLYTDTDLVFVGQVHEVLAQLLEVFAWLRPSTPTVLALEHLVEIIDREQCLSAVIDIPTAKGNRP